MQGRCFDLTTFQSEGEDGVVLEVEVALGVVVEEVGGEGDVGVVDACVEIQLESGPEGRNGEVLKVDVVVG